MAGWLAGSGWFFALKVDSSYGCQRELLKPHKWKPVDLPEEEEVDKSYNSSKYLKRLEAHNEEVRNPTGKWDKDPVKY